RQRPGEDSKTARIGWTRNRRRRESNMMITKRHLSRRAVLKGIGVTVALPFLDAMAPAATALANTAAKGKLRFVAVEMVHGAAGSSTYGAQHNLWSPSAVGRGFDLSPTSLA